MSLLSTGRGARARARVIAAPVLALAAVAAHAHADVPATAPTPTLAPAPTPARQFTYGIAQAITHESNLYRASGGGQDDWLSITALEVRADQPLGRGRWRGQAVLRAQRYAEHHDFDSDDHKAALALDVPTASPLSGSLGGHSSQQRHRDEMDTETLEFRWPTVKEHGAYLQAQWAGSADWSLLAGADGVERSFLLGSQFQPAVDMSQYSVEAGAAWRPSAAIGGSLKLRHTRIDRPLSLTGSGGDVGRREAEWQGQWRTANAGLLQARLAHVQERRVAYSDRSFWTGGVAWDVSPSDALRLRAAAFRDTEGLSGHQDPFGSEARFIRLGDVLRDGLRLSAEWAAHPSTQVLASARLSARQMDLPQSWPGAAATDRTVALSIGVRYSPWRSLELGCDLTHEKRDVNGANRMSWISFPYEAALVGCQLAWWHR